jgi:hypothetical protein
VGIGSGISATASTTGVGPGWIFGAADPTVAADRAPGLRTAVDPGSGSDPVVRAATRAGDRVAARLGEFVDTSPDD